MFVVDYRHEVHAESHAPPGTNIGYARKLRLFKTLGAAHDFAASIPKEWGHHEVREVASDDIFEMAQDLLAIASSYCAAKNVDDALVSVARAVALLESFRGEPLPEGYELLLYGKEENEERDDG